MTPTMERLTQTMGPKQWTSYWSTNFFPRKKNLTLSFLVIKLIEEFIPALHYKYVFQNLKQTSLYRAYNPVVVPKYLQCRPKSVILHCLHRKSKSLKYTSSDISEVDVHIGIFEVKGKRQNHTVDFSIPSCTCKDWIAHHIPCKHFLWYLTWKKVGIGTNFQHFICILLT